MPNEWLILKIFPKYKDDWSDALTKVFLCKKRFLKELEKLAEGQKTFFLHYADYRDRERPHFKFFVENPQNILEFISWVKKRVSNKDLIDIGLFFGFEDETLEEGKKAKEVVELLKLEDKIPLKDLKKKLMATEYINLKSDIGQHYVHNMLELDYISEKEIRGLKI